MFFQNSGAGSACFDGYGKLVALDCCEAMATDATDVVGSDTANSAQDCWSLSMGCGASGHVGDGSQGRAVLASLAVPTDAHRFTS